MLICARCDKPILRGQRHESRDIPSPSGAGHTVHLHKEPCKRKPSRTTQDCISL
jgi:hypothetical protein